MAFSIKRTQPIKNTQTPEQKLAEVQDELNFVKAQLEELQKTLDETRIKTK